jgi:hypothetical protein
MSIAEDLDQLRSAGYVAQRNVLCADEVEALGDTVERVARRITDAAQRPGAGPEIELADGVLEQDGDPLEAPAGSVAWFGSLLLHRSAPNLSDRDRRAVLHSFQPHGRAHYRDTPFEPRRVERLP